MLLGFFGGVLLDALGSDLFGVGALGGLLAAMLASRSSAVRRRGSERVLLAQVAGLAVAGYDLLGYSARWLAGLGVPQLSEYAVVGRAPRRPHQRPARLPYRRLATQIVNIKTPHGWEYRSMSAISSSSRDARYERVPRVGAGRGRPKATADKRGRRAT